MTDFEDSNSPKWANQIQGQINLGKAIRRTLTLGAGRQDLSAQRQDRHAAGAPARLAPRRKACAGRRRSASRGGIFDFALFFFHNAKEQIARGAGPYFYLPKMESHLEARLWNDIFVMAQNELGMPQGTIKATVLIETILAAFEMDEILYELREHSRRPQRRALGLHLLVHQEVQDRPRLLPGRPREGDDDRAVHARLCAAAAEDLPPARRAGDRRHERADPDQERPREERDRDGRHHRRQAPRRERRLRRRLGRAPGAGGRGDEGVRRRARRPAEPVRASRSPTSHVTAPTCSNFAARAADHRGRPAHEHQRRHPLPRRLARRQRLRADLQPDGRRRHRRDQPLAGVAVDPLARRACSTTAARSPPTWCVRWCPRSWPKIKAGGFEGKFDRAARDLRRR